MYLRLKQEERPKRLCEASSHPDNGQQASFGPEHRHAADPAEPFVC